MIRTRHAVAGAGLVLLIIAASFLDRPLTELAATIDPAWKAVFRQITRLGKSEWYLVPTGVFVLLWYALGWLPSRATLRERWRTAMERCLWIFSAVAVSGIAVNVLKVLFGRARPRLLQGDDPAYGMHWFTFGADHSSFPSGHSNTAFAMALAIGALWPKARLPALAAASMIAASRIIVGAHFLSDVFAGMTVAVLTSAWLAGWFRRRGIALPQRTDANDGA